MGRAGTGDAAITNRGYAEAASTAILGTSWRVSGLTSATHHYYTGAKPDLLSELSAGAWPHSPPDCVRKGRSLDTSGYLSPRQGAYYALVGEASVVARGP